MLALYVGEKNPLCLEFDHITLGSKEGNVSQMSMNKVGTLRLKEEMSKCRILCSSCHQIKTAIEQKTYAYLRIKEMGLFQDKISEIEKLVEKEIEEVEVHYENNLNK